MHNSCFEVFAKSNVCIYMVCFPFLFLSMYDSSFYLFTWLIIFSWKLDIIEHHFSNCHSRWKLSFSWTLIVKNLSSLHFTEMDLYSFALFPFIPIRWVSPPFLCYLHHSVSFRLSSYIIKSEGFCFLSYRLWECIQRSKISLISPHMVLSFKLPDSSYIFCWAIGLTNVHNSYNIKTYMKAICGVLLWNACYQNFLFKFSTVNTYFWHLEWLMLLFPMLFFIVLGKKKWQRLLGWKA